MTKLTKGQTVFLLKTNPIDVPTKEEPSVYEMVVREESGRLVADAKEKHGPFTIRVDVTNRTLDDFETLFATREEAVAAYEASIASEIDFFENQPKKDFFMDLYLSWTDGFNADPRVMKTIKDKIKTDFGVDVD